MDGGVWIRHRFMVVRGFCCVKFGAGVSVSDGGGEIPAYAGMTWVGAGMTWVGTARPLPLRRVRVLVIPQPTHMRLAVQQTAQSGGGRRAAIRPLPDGYAQLAQHVIHVQRFHAEEVADVGYFDFCGIVDYSRFLSDDFAAA